MLLDGDVGLARTYVDELERLPATARRLQAQARIAWLSGDHDRAERLATAAWEQADELRPRTVDGLAAMLAQISIGRGDGQAGCEMSGTRTQFRAPRWRHHRDDSRHGRHRIRPDRSRRGGILTVAERALGPGAASNPRRRRDWRQRHAPAVDR